MGYLFKAKQLLSKIFLLSIPFLLLIASYIIFDPFWVLYQYPDFADNLITIPNRDYVSTEMYINTSAKRKYTSFILGNSRTMAFSIRDWRKYTNDSLSFHYDASGESLFGIWKKLLFIEQHSQEINNALLIVDSELLAEVKDFDSHFRRKDPRITGEWPFAFHFSFLKAYFSDLFFFSYYQKRFLHKSTSEMDEMFESRRVHFDPVTNDMSLPDIEQEIHADSIGFYNRNKRLWPRNAKPTVAQSVTGAEQIQQLVAIHNIFKKHHTKYQIVISPMYEQVVFNPADLSCMQRIFGAEHVHDFSGVNKFTQVVGNYYEDMHYRPSVGREIMREIYTSKPIDSSK
ncbi:hypothetical protein ACFST9_06825 [Hymenobacter monticola]|uniref:Uncharacterized protein n=1 Tax=Hymenobacter monticola TaxID=1705399 RepID=A0ABY4B0H5_9BACT|nr:hypothetical protein [Hymenobacter monticola]UOE31847.1 hypothetical protein MTP16_11945 [Hymenobacter monticola]